MVDNPRAFVLMLFDSEFEPVYEQLIKPALEDAGYEVRRADSSLDQQNILRDIIKGITMANLIIADLTTNNSNVFYELGIYHGLKIPTILLAQSRDDIPFDLLSYKILTYSTDFMKAHEVTVKLKEIGEKHRNKEVVFGSPVLDFYSEEDALRRKSLGLDEEYSLQVHPIDSREEKGVLDLVVEGEEAGTKLVSIVLELTALAKDFGDRIVGHGTRITALNEKPGIGTAAKLSTIVSEIATDMKNYSKNIEGHLPSYESEIDKYIANTLKFIRIFEIKTSNKESIIKFRKTVTGLMETTSKTLLSFNKLQSSVAQLQGISKELNRSARILSQTIEEMMTVTEKMQSFCVRSLALIDEKMEIQSDVEDNMAG